MRKRFPRILDGPGATYRPELLCLSVCFLLGIVLGCLLAGYLGENAQSHLSAYLNDYFAVLRDGEVLLPSLFSTIWELCRWPLLVFLCGFTALGAVAVPAVFLIRGFLLSFSISVFVRLFGGPGALAALAVFGVSGFFAVPALFLLGVGAFRTAKSLLGTFFRDSKRSHPFHAAYFIRAGGCAVLLAMGVMLQSWVTPRLLQAVAEMVP